MQELFTNLIFQNMSNLSTLSSPSHRKSFRSGQQLIQLPRLSSGRLFFHPNDRRHQKSWRICRIETRDQSLGSRKICRRRRDMAVLSSAAPGPPPAEPPRDSWLDKWGLLGRKVWIVGMVASMIYPFSKNKWGPLSRLKQKVEVTMEDAEEAAGMVEKAAEEVEKIAEEVADHLPDGGRLKKAAVLTENIAKEIARDAHLAEEIIDKVEEVEKEVTELIDEREADGANHKAMVASEEKLDQITRGTTKEE